MPEISVLPAVVVVLQVAAAFLSFGLARKMGSRTEWGLVVFVLTLVAALQFVTFQGALFGDAPLPPGLVEAVSILVAVGSFLGVAMCLLLPQERLVSAGDADSTRAGTDERKSLALRQSEETFRNLTEGSLQGILVTRNGKPVFANQSYVRMYGFGSPDEVLKLASGMGLIAPEDRERINSYRQDRLAGLEVPSEYEFVGLTQQGERIHVRTSVRVVNWFGEPALQNTNIDITDLKRAQSEMKRHRDRAERANRAKSEFLARMSHELRTPLNAIIGFSEVLENAEQLNIAEDQLGGYVRDIHSSAHHLLDLINDVLDVVTMESGKRRFNFDAVDLESAVEESITLVESDARRKRIDIMAAVPEGLPDLVADERSVRQVLINLLANAVKFTRPGGRVVVTANAEDGAITLTVSDTGIGMADDEIGRLMQPFERGWSDPYVSEEGTGLGLAIVQGLVSAHGGRLKITSEVGQWTEVAVWLPLRRNQLLQRVVDEEALRLIA